MRHPRLALPPHALEPDLQRLLAAVDTLAPEPMNMDLGERAFPRGVVELDAQTRFLPIPFPRKVSARLKTISHTVGGIAGVLGAGLAAWLDLGFGLVELFGAGVLAGFGAAQLTLHVLGPAFRGRSTTHTGILLRPRFMLIRRARRIDIIPRSSLAAIREHMREEPGPTRHDPPKTHYATKLSFKPRRGPGVWPLLELVVIGEADMALRAAHPEGRFIGGLTRYLIQHWLHAESANEDEVFEVEL